MDGVNKSLWNTDLCFAARPAALEINYTVHFAPGDIDTKLKYLHGLKNLCTSSTSPGSPATQAHLKRASSHGRFSPKRLRRWCNRYAKDRSSRARGGEAERWLTLAFLWTARLTSPEHPLWPFSGSCYDRGAVRFWAAWTDSHVRDGPAQEPLSALRGKKTRVQKPRVNTRHVKRKLNYKINFKI